MTQQKYAARIETRNMKYMYFRALIVLFMRCRKGVIYMMLFLLAFLLTC